MSFWEQLDNYANKAIDVYENIEVAKAGAPKPSTNGMPQRNTRPETVAGITTVASPSGGAQVAPPSPMAGLPKWAIGAGVAVVALVGLKVAKVI